MDRKEYEQYERDVACGLNGLDHVSTGFAPACQECADGFDFDTLDDAETAYNAGQVVEEPSFSWSACECCGDTDGGDRYDAHARDEHGAIVHLNVCPNCMYYINYGHLDDATMPQIDTVTP